MKDIVETIGKYIGDFQKEDQSTVYTPMNIVEDMVGLLPDDIFKPEKKFIDIACKSGRFLLAIYNRLMNSHYMSHMEQEQRSKWILDNQLYAIALTDFSSTLIKKVLYNDYTVKGNIILINGYIDKMKRNNFGQNKDGSVKTFREYLSEEFNQVEFNVVIGNPPYNNDIYLDFVTQGHNLAKQYDVWITPAKWQAKGGKKNEDFRENIVPYMSKIVYYPCAQELFDIRNLDGISYYLIDKDTHRDKEIKNASRRVKSFNNESKREICGQLNNIAFILINRIRAHKMLSSNKLFLNQSIKYKYKLIIMGMAGNCYYDNQGMTLGINKTYIVDDISKYSKDYFILYSSDNINEINSFDSVIKSKLIRFIAVVSLCGQRCDNKESWRFIPDPGLFDHIFTDEELYKKYNLTPDEIDIIESVIKAR